MSESAPRGPRLLLICVNDVYSLENLPRLATLIARHKASAEADRVLTTLAGDFLAPSLLSSLDKGRGMVDCLNHLPIEVVTFGNHEDDVEVEALRQRAREYAGVWLGTNVPGFDPPLPSSMTLEVAAPGGRAVRVGLLGVVMADPAVYRRPPFGVAHVEPANAAAVREAARLRAAGCACVLPLTHQPVADDRVLAAEQRAPPFPVIVGGHEHEPYLEEVQGTWIVKAGMDARAAVLVDLEWPAEPPAPGAPDLPAVKVRLEPVAGDPEDAGLRARVDGHLAAVRELAAATLVRLGPGEQLSSVGTRAQQASLGTLLSSRLRDALGADGCVLNGGGIRGARSYGERLTFGDLEEEVPFDNEVVVVPIPGSVLAEAVAQSRADAPREAGRFLQVDDAMEVGPNNALLRVAGAPLEPERPYRIALVRNLLAGMDHIEPLVRYAREHPEALPPEGSGRGIRTVLVDAFSAELWRQLGGFDAVDVDRNGQVTAQEVAAALSRLTGAPASPVAVELLMHLLDADRDRAISRAEAEALPRGKGR